MARPGEVRSIAPSRHWWLGSRILVALLSVVLTLTLLEVVFRHIPRTAGLADPLWYARCWKRDGTGRRVQPLSQGGQRKVVVVGDSFAAGVGICDPRDRFVDQMAARLDRGHPGRFQVFLLADRGMNTRQEWELLRRFPHRPDLIVLSYYFNDIDDAALDAGIYPAHPVYSSLPSWFGWLVQRSYLANFVYWSVPNPEFKPYHEHYVRAWSTPEVVARHLRELDPFFSFRVPVVLVVFPHLPDLELSALFADRVVAHARARGAYVIDVRDLVRDLRVSQRVVHVSDTHAAVVVHHRVGRDLAAVVERALP